MTRWLTAPEGRIAARSRRDRAIPAARRGVVAFAVDGVRRTVCAHGIGYAGSGATGEARRRGPQT